MKAYTTPKVKVYSVTPCHIMASSGTPNQEGGSLRSRRYVNFDDEEEDFTQFGR